MYLPTCVYKIIRLRIIMARKRCLGSAPYQRVVIPKTAISHYRRSHSVIAGKRSQIP